MKVRLSFVGYLKIDGVASGGTVSVAANTTIADLLTRHNVRPEHQRYITAAVNGEEKKLSHVLKDGDDLALFMPIGGG
ncbi:MAG: MoaD/ThiS family protein [Kiritimatiellae bacterium]|nr:MoaD/ThiS family protein [Kiritimatiellia bacterium]